MHGTVDEGDAVSLARFIAQQLIILIIHEKTAVKILRVYFRCVIVCLAVYTYLIQKKMEY